MVMVDWWNIWLGEDGLHVKTFDIEDKLIVDTVFTVLDDAEQYALSILRGVSKDKALQYTNAQDLLEALELSAITDKASNDYYFAKTIPCNDDEIGRMRNNWLIAANKSVAARVAVLARVTGNDG